MGWRVARWTALVLLSMALLACPIGLWPLIIITAWWLVTAYRDRVDEKLMRQGMNSLIGK